MDLAHNLIRSAARSFYPPEQILIVDALLQHNALRDDDLAHLMGLQTKHLRKLASKLKDDGLISVHSRAEIREGNTRPNNRDYYFVDYHRTIDVIKYRLKRMTKAIEDKYGQAPEEKKDYVCKTCKAEYTQMEVLDMVSARGFVCRRCHSILNAREEGDPSVSSVGHEVQGRLNAQLKAFEDLMRRIDNTDIPENDFDKAIANALPVQRDNALNPGVRSVPVADGRLPAATVRGMKTEEKITVNLLGEGDTGDDAAEKERKAKLAAQNALPVWHTSSTVTAPATSTADYAPPIKTEEDVKPDIKRDPAEESTDSKDGILNMEDFWAQYNAEQAKKAQEEASQDSDDEDDEDEDDGFEDVLPASQTSLVTSQDARKRQLGDSSVEASPAKRVKGEDAHGNGVLSASESASTSQAATPAAAMANGVETNGVKKEREDVKKESEDDDDDDDDGFEDAL